MWKAWIPGGRWESWRAIRTPSGSSANVTLPTVSPLALRRSARAAWGRAGAGVISACKRSPAERAVVVSPGRDPCAIDVSSPWSDEGFGRGRGTTPPRNSAKPRSSCQDAGDPGVPVPGGADLGRADLGGAETFQTERDGAAQPVEAAGLEQAVDGADLE